MDPAYLGMKPITCIDSTPYEAADHCAVTYGNGILLPVFNQLGYATQVYNNLATGNLSYCNCSEWADYNEEQRYSCNLFNFLTGFIFWNDAIYLPDPLLELTNLESSHVNRKVRPSFPYSLPPSLPPSLTYFLPHSLTPSLTYLLTYLLVHRLTTLNFSRASSTTATSLKPVIILIFVTQVLVVTALF